jgi:ribosomal protein S8E
MARPFIPVLVGALFLAGAAQAQQNVNVRGTITAFDGKVIQVKARDGRDLRVNLPEKVGVATTKAITLSDIKPGTVVGVTTVKRADGAVVAIDVRPIPPTAPLGLSAYDLQPGSTMTNATLEGAVQSTGGQELTLNYKTGQVKVLVPPGTPMTQAVPGSRADLKPGETIYIAARPGEDGTLNAVRVQVSKDGVKPSQ